MAAPSALKPADRVFFLSLAVATAVYIALRITFVPWVHDEARAYQVLVLPRDYLLLTGPWEVGNHFLQTLMMVAGDALAGVSHWSLRGWSLLAFLLFARYAWAMGAWVQDRVLRRCLWMALVLAPFQLDFFGLARGYAWGNAFLMMALFHAVRFMASGRTGQLLLTLCALQGMAYSVLSMLVPALVIGAILLGAVLWRDKAGRRLTHMLWLVAAGLVPAVPAVLFGTGLSARGMLYAGSGAGFLSGTVRSLGVVIFPAHGDLLAYGVCGIVMACSTLVGWSAFRQRRPDAPATIVVMVTVLAALGFIVLHQLRGVLYPVDRGALCFVPLTAVVIALALDPQVLAAPRWRHAAWALLLLPLNTLRTADLSRTVLWPEQATPKAFRALVAERQHTMDRPAMVGGHRFMSQTWSLDHMAADERLNELDTLGFPHDRCDMLLIDTTLRAAPAGFHCVARASGGRNALYARSLPLRTSIALDSMIAGPQDMSEYFKFWEPVAAAWIGRSAFVEAEAALACEQGVTGSRVILEVVDSTGGHALYTDFPTDHQRGRGTDGRLHICLRLPLMPASVRRIAFYLYNPQRASVRVSDAHVRIHELLPG
jgi:hypothetical protein